MAFISEPQVYQTDVAQYMRGVQHEYCYSLNSDDLRDPELPQIKSRAIGGTLVLWRKYLDPYISIHLVESSAFLPLILKLPGAKVSVHIAVYLPTHGKDTEFISEIAALENCIDELLDMFDKPLIFIRGDGNCNPKNQNRYQVLQNFIYRNSMKKVDISHPTYHHFVGNGQYDSNIDILLHTAPDITTEIVLKIMCRNNHPEISSHHDLIFSELTLPYQAPPTEPIGNTVAPRTTYERSKILWTDQGREDYETLLSSQLKDLRKTWLCSSSLASTSVLLQSTSSILSLAATSTNPCVSLNETRADRQTKPPKQIVAARRRLNTKHRMLARTCSANAKAQFLAARKAYRDTVRKCRLSQSLRRDQKLDSILSKDPRGLYAYLRQNKQTKNQKIQSLKVGSKVYQGDRVGDGFYDSMTALKSCDLEYVSSDPHLAHHFINYQHILKICEEKKDIPEICLDQAAKLLKRMKAHVTDINGITPLHFLHAGEEGVRHFAALMNVFISEVKNVTLPELNTVLGVILSKGQKKDKNSDRSYRTISTCPFLAKSLDLYVRDLYQDLWNDTTASTQYLATGSSHELASLLVTEMIQYSLHVKDQPVYLLVLDAQSAYDRCLRQVLCTELFMTGVTGSALLLLNSRLENRSTVYQWDGQMLGPARDDTGFEQGGINSGDFYKLYNNEQLKSAQNSHLGVDIDSSVVAAIGQADDVILAANNLYNLKLLARLTEVYCTNFRVKLVASKTKLLPIYLPRHSHLVEYAKIVNNVAVDNTKVEFVPEAEHVGVLRNTAGNMSNILQRIACHKAALHGVSSAGMARSHRGNPAASLRVHQLYALPVLLNGLASLVLSQAELKILDNHHKNTIQNIQRLHYNTPRAVVFLLAGSLPFRAVLHLRQLSLFSMVSHLHGNPLNTHGRHILNNAPQSARSWFQQVRSICDQYGLGQALELIDNPEDKKAFKTKAKAQVMKYWHEQFVIEASKLKSLKYFKPELYSLRKPHYMWCTAASNPYECSKSTLLARMVSGRYRSDMLCRHWSSNRTGSCRAPTCSGIPGTLEHLLVSCPALGTTRERLYQMWLERTVMFPGLHQSIRNILEADPTDIVQFILEPLAFPLILADYQTHGSHYAQQLSYLTRTFAFSIHQQYQKLVKSDPDHTVSHSCSFSNIPVSGPGVTTDETSYGYSPGTCPVDRPSRPAESRPARPEKSSSARPARPAECSPARPVSPARPAECSSARPAEGSPARPAEYSPARAAECSPTRPARCKGPRTPIMTGYYAPSYPPCITTSICSERDCSTCVTHAKVLSPAQKHLGRACSVGVSGQLCDSQVRSEDQHVLTSGAACDDRAGHLTDQHQGGAGGADLVNESFDLVKGGVGTTSSFAFSN